MPAGRAPATGPLARFSRPVAEWFATSFPAPTAAQEGAWPAIAAGENVLLCAPTGSGKTLAAFLWAVDRLAVAPRAADAPESTRVLYLSPLRALAVDVEKNLRAPLRGIALAAERLGVPLSEPTVGIRTGDTPPEERRRLARHPPDILITTPESLYLMLTSAARDTLAGVESVIVDEIHAVAGTKRGAHLALTLERLERVVDRPPQRIGLSATVRPLEEIAHFLGGNLVDPLTGAAVGQRPVTIVDAGVRKELDLRVVVPIEDMGSLGQFVDEPASGSAQGGLVRRSIWPSVHPRLLELIEQHRSTIVFVNARRLSERLASRLNELAAGGENRGGENDGTGTTPGHELVRAHHGSLSREQRLVIEDELKRGDLRALVATSSLELGIDMGAVDLVIQIESPGSVARGLQRVGRAGHQVGEPSRGRIFPKHRADLLEAAVVVQRMDDGLIESTRFLRNPLDVLAQQVVAMCALDEWSLAEVTRLVRGAAPFGDLSDDLLGGVLDLLDGRYPSEEFGGLRPNIVWDRSSETLRGRSGTQRLAVTNPGTIPDRGLFGVFLPDGARVGELDEEMVYESRPGETFLLGASTWRISEITHDRVVVTPAPGQPGKMPFWHGDGPGRPIELGRAVGAFVREIRAMPRDRALQRLGEVHHLDDLAAENLLAYLDEQAEATTAVPDDRTVVVERFRDEIGDWRICVHTPFGARVNAPWAIALRHRLSDRLGDDVELMWSDDGIIVRLPESVDQLDPDDLALDPDEVTSIVVDALPSTSLFASRFRECAARALLLPRRRVDRRTPLWQQRQRAADLLTVAARYPTFPILLETTRECVNDVFDLPALVEVLGDIRSRRLRVVQVDTPTASPFAQSLLFSWIAVYMYEGDAPLAERRAAALALDRDLLRDLLGEDELRSLIDPDVLVAIEDELQRRVEGRLARDADELVDLCRLLGPLSTDELVRRSAESLPLEELCRQLVAERRLIAVAIAGDERWADAADAARLRDALGVAIPAGLPTTFTDPVEHPLRDLVERHARTHGPFTTSEVALRWGAAPDAVRVVLEELERAGRVVRGEFRPTGIEREWCDPDVVRMLRRRTLASLRSEIEPVPTEALGRFLPRWQGVGSGRRGSDALYDVVAQLQGAPLVASALEVDVLGSRVEGYRPADLDALCTMGEVAWVGAGSIGGHDGRVRLLTRRDARLLFPPPDPTAEGDVAGALRSHLTEVGASFWWDLVAAAVSAGVASSSESEQLVMEAIWDLVWAGEVTNDSLVPLRARIAGGASGRGRRRRPGRLARSGPPAGSGRWSLTTALRRPEPSATEVLAARADQLLDRYGVLTREMALAEGTQAGFAGVYPVLKAMEEQGQIRRGYFVAGLGAAQFAKPGAVDLLRSYRGEVPGGHPDGREREVVWVTLAATDPAQPYGAALPWPDSAGRPSRAAGALVLLADGEAVAHLEKGGRAVLTFPGAASHPEWVDQLASLPRSGRRSRLELVKVDGEPVASSAWYESLRGAGFAESYRGVVLRASSIDQ